MKQVRKAVSLLLAVVMVFSMTGMTALAEEPDLSQDSGPAIGSSSNLECSCGTEDGIHTEDCPLYEEPDEPETDCTCGAAEGEAHKEGCPLYEEPKNPEAICTCGAAEGEAHQEGCPLYEAPGEPETDCTCGAAEGEAHQEGCPLHKEPQTPEVACGGLAGCKDGAHDPQCPLYVVPAISDAAAKLQEMIQELPTAEDLAAQAPDEDMDSGYEEAWEKYQDTLDAVKEKVAAIREAYNALSEEEKDAFDGALLTKLDELEELLSAQTVLMTMADVTIATVTVENGQTLQQAFDAQVGADQYDKITDLTIVTAEGAEITPADFWFLRDTLTKLASIDMENAACQNDTIPSCAFYNPDTQQGKLTLTTFVFPQNIRVISDNFDDANVYEGAFMFCDNLEGDLVLPDTVEKVGGSAFRPSNSAVAQNGSKLVLKHLSDNLEVVGQQAFHSLQLPSEGLTIPQSVKQIQKHGFYYMRGSGPLTFEERATDNTFTIDSLAFASGGYTGPLVLPDSLVALKGGQNFSNCAGFTSLTLGTGVKEYFPNTFMNCTGMTGALTIPPTVEKLNSSVFAGTNFTSIEFQAGLDGKNTVSLDKNAFRDMDQVTEITVDNLDCADSEFAFNNTNLAKVKKVTVRNSNLKSIAFTSPELEEVLVENCPDTLVTFGNNPKLKSLQLNNVKTDSELKLYGAQLENVSLSNLNSVTKLNLAQHPYAPKLNQLEVSQCVNISNIDLYGTALETVDFSEVGVNSLILRVWGNKMLSDLKLAESCTLATKEKLSSLFYDNAIDFSGGDAKAALSQIKIDQSDVNKYDTRRQVVLASLDPASTSQTNYVVSVSDLTKPADYLKNITPVLRTYSGTDVSSLMSGTKWRSTTNNGERVAPSTWLLKVKIDDTEKTAEEIAAMLTPTVSGPNSATTFAATLGTWTFTWTIGDETITKTVEVMDTSTSIQDVSFDNIIDGKTTTVFGTDLQLSAKVNNAAISGNDWIWQSSDSTVATVNQSGLVTPHKAGTATISVMKRDGSAQGSVEVTVTRKLVTVAVTDTKPSYTGEVFFPALTYDGTVEGTDPSVSLKWDKVDSSVTSIIDAGTYTASLAEGNAQDDHYQYQLDASAKTFTVQRAAPSIVVQNKIVTFNGQPQSVSVYGAGSAGATVTYGESNEAPTNAGTYPITVTPIDPNYQPTPATGTLTIEKAPLALSLQVQKGDGAAAGDTVTLTASVSGMIEGFAPAGKLQFLVDDAAVGNLQSVNETVIQYWVSTAGQHTLTVAYIPADTGENYTAVDAVLENYDVSKKDQPALSVEAVPEKTVGEPDFILSITGGVGEIAPEYTVTSGDAVTVDGSGKVAIVKAGTAVITVKRPANDIYNEAFTSVSITVKEAAAQLIPDGLSGKVLVAKQPSLEDSAALQAQIDGTYKSKFDGMDVVKMDVQLIDISSGSEITNEAVSFTIGYPNEEVKANYRKYTFVVLHTPTVGEPEIVSYTATAEGLKVSVSSLSPFAVGYKVKPTGGSSSSGGSGNDSHDDRNYDFWDRVEEKIKDADSGDIIKVDAKSYDKMPWTVMEALRKNSGVSLVIKWNGGDTITIPAGKAAKAESGRIYYPLSLLEEMYKDAQLKDPATGNLVDPSKLNPNTGGPMGGAVMEITAPAVSEDIQNITPKTEGMSPDTLTMSPVTPAAEAEPVETSNNGILFAVIAAVLATMTAAGLFIWKKRSHS